MNEATGRDLTIMGVGDVYLNRPDPASAFANVAPVLEQGDINLGNLESTLCDDRAQPNPSTLAAGGIHLRSSPSTIKGVTAGRFKAMGLANNHSLDYGNEAMFQTIELLDQAGVTHSGGGHNLEEAHRPAVVEHNGTRVALISNTSVFPAEVDKSVLATLKIHTSYEAPESVLFHPGFPPIIITIPDPIELDMMLDDIRRAKEIADIVVLCPHWGISQGYERVVGYQKAVGRLAIDAGVDFVMGAHSHCLLGMEMYKGKLICYSLGNFIWDGKIFPYFGGDTAIIKCHVHDKQIQKYSLIPARINKQTNQSELLGREQATEVARSLETMSEEFGTTFTPEGDEFAIGGPKPGTPEPLTPPAVYADSLLPLSYLKNRKPFGQRWGLIEKMQAQMRR
ncbi:CapA family protein [Chloroflexota bacterium]